MASPTSDHVRLPVLEASNLEVLRGLDRLQLGADPEAVHDTRVAMRRLEAHLHLVLPHRHARGYRRALARLTDMRRTLGAARDLEVAEALRMELAAGNAASADVGLVAAAAKARTRGATRVLGQRADLEARMAVVLAHLGPVDVARARQRLASRGQKVLARAAKAAGDPSFARLHALRIAVKKLRYGLEAAGALGMLRAPPGTATRLKRLQECLGNMLDLHVAAHLLPGAGADPHTVAQAVAQSEQLRRLVAEALRPAAGLPTSEPGRP